MSIKVVNGDVTKASENIIVHQVNCQGKMASGVAKSVRQAFPKAYTEYMELYNKVDDSEQLLGHAQVVRIKEGKEVINLFGQLFYGYDGHRYTSYDALYDGLQFVKAHAKQEGLSVAIPYGIGSARGGADWDVVYTMITKIFEGVDVTLYKYAEGKGQQVQQAFEKAVTSSQTVLRSAMESYRKTKRGE